jgi:hypothetical protein
MQEQKDHACRWSKKFRLADHPRPQEESYARVQLGGWLAGKTLDDGHKHTASDPHRLGFSLGLRPFDFSNEVRATRRSAKYLDPLSLNERKMAASISRRIIYHDFQLEV